MVTPSAACWSCRQPYDQRQDRCPSCRRLSDSSASRQGRWVASHPDDAPKEELDRRSFSDHQRRYIEACRRSGRFREPAWTDTDAIALALTLAQELATSASWPLPSDDAIVLKFALRDGDLLRDVVTAAESLRADGVVVELAGFRAAILDLHGYRRDTAVLALRKGVEAAWIAGCDRVEVIYGGRWAKHGDGRAPVREAVARELEDSPVLRRFVRRPVRHGDAAAVVYLRQADQVEQDLERLPRLPPREFERQPLRPD